jgi:hypothetical protein
MATSEHRWVSRHLRQAVKTSGVPQYLLARRVGVDRSVLSAWLCGMSRVRVNDVRVIALGKILGVAPGACFARQVYTRAPRLQTSGRVERQATLRRSA